MIDLDALSVSNGIESDLEYVRFLLKMAAYQAEAGLHDPAALTPQVLYHAVINANDSYAHVIDQVEALIHFARRMMEQRESVKDAYLQGWNGAIKDLIDKLDNVEYAELRSALDEINSGKR